MLEQKTITFLGAGSMAEAILGGLISKQIVKPEQIIVTNFQDQQKLTRLAGTYDVNTTSNRMEAVRRADIIILAMKPKHVKEALEEVQTVTRPDQLFVSVLAGIPTDYMESLLKGKASVIRTMPNTSAKVGASATAISKGAYANDEQLQVVEALFAAIGTVTVVEEEKLDAVTGLAGSGPAYFYYLIEAMEKAAVDNGLTKEEASALITQTVIGVGQRLQKTEKSAKELYEEVMSPNGTTEAGIGVLREYHMQDVMEKAIAQAIARSKELGVVFHN
ncbi:pyrroline-5-carboxylate reductase [Halalkalibacter oceani]|uniref:pyrroline-5-carboxylate reductase n=1 Tax=Halalkalibacter oceani TaxID=1653776 RepID=UPI0033968938